MIVLPTKTIIDDSERIVRGADTFYRIAKEKMNVEVVAAICDNTGRVTNAKDLVPRKIEIIPDIITVHSGEDDYRNYVTSLNQRCRHPAENCVFVYAYNVQGKLIQPWYDSTLSPTRGRCPYQLFLFGQHYNRTNDSVAYRCDSDFLDEIVLGYDPDLPKRNPFHAIMVKPQSAGQYAIRVHARLQSDLANNLSKEDLLPEQGSDGPAGRFTVNIVNGVERLDTLGLLVSKEGALIIDENANAILYLNLKEPIEVRVVGIKARKVWKTKSASDIDRIEDASISDRRVDQDNLDSQADSYEVSRSIVTPKDLCWVFEPDANVKVAGAAIVEMLSGNATHVRITGMSAGKEGGRGDIYIHAYGRKWRVHVQIK